MILQPLLPDPASPTELKTISPAWTLVSQMQSQQADQYLLVGQPDHAKLSGELAARFKADFLPTIDHSLAQAIGAHDAGWAQHPFERDLRGDPPLTDNGRPQHFMQVPLEESLSAWTGSIKAAGDISKLGEYMVSGHFSRIGRMRIQTEMDTSEDRERLERFVADEEQYQRQLASSIDLSREQLARYVDFLQFCDVLSLYLCCGAKQPAEFPQEFDGRKIRVRYEDGVYVSDPALFGRTERFHLKVRVFPSEAGEGHTQVGFHIR